MRLFEQLAVTVRTLHHFNHVADRSERIPELVSKRREEFVLTLIGLRQIRRQFAQVIFESPSFGDVARNLRRANDVSRIVPYRCNGERNGEVLPVAAEAFS